MNHVYFSYDLNTTAGIYVSATVIIDSSYIVEGKAQFKYACRNMHVCLWIPSHATF